MVNIKFSWNNFYETNARQWIFYFHSQFLHLIISKGLFNFVVKWSLQAHMMNCLPSVAPRKPNFIHEIGWPYLQHEKLTKSQHKKHVLQLYHHLLLHVLRSKLILKIFSFLYDIFQICHWNIWNNLQWI